MLGCPGGSVFTEFLGALNACTGMPGPAYEGFAGHCDWRLPMMSELASIVDTTVLGCAVDAPCIDPIFGPTAIDFTYWSASSSSTDPTTAGTYFFANGLETPRARSG